MKKLILGGFLILFSILLFIAPSVGEVIYEDIFEVEGTTTFSYYPYSTAYTGSCKHDYINRLRFFQTENLADLDLVSLVTRDTKYWSVNEGYSYNYYVDSLITEVGGNKGNISHGYSIDAEQQILVYNIYIKDIDTSGLSGTTTWTLSTENLGLTIYACDCVGLDLNGSSTAVIADLEYAGKYYPVDNDINLLPSYGNWDYTIMFDFHFLNSYLIEEIDDDIFDYRFNITREGLDSYTTKSTWYVWDDNYTYWKEGVEDTHNESFYTYNTMCNGLYIWCNNSEFNLALPKTLTSLCIPPVVEWINFSLRGYVFSETGHTIPNATIEVTGVDYGANIVYTEDNGYYNFPLLRDEGGEFALGGNKTGYYNNTVDMQLYTDGEYIHNLYLIKKTSLAAGEIGGFLYDSCSKEGLSNAAITLVNATTGETIDITFTSQSGFFKFSDLSVGKDYELFGEKNGYVTSPYHPFTFSEDEKVINIYIYPSEGCPEDGGMPTPTPTPVPTPTPAPGEEERGVTAVLDALFESLGLTAWKGFIYAMILIGGFMLVGAVVGNGNTIGIIVGGAFGFIISIAQGWLPSYLLVIVILIAALFAAKMFKGGE